MKMIKIEFFLLAGPVFYLLYRAPREGRAGVTTGTGVTHQGSVWPQLCSSLGLCPFPLDPSLLHPSSRALAEHPDLDSGISADPRPLQAHTDCAEALLRDMDRAGVTGEGNSHP